MDNKTPEQAWNEAIEAAADMCCNQRNLTTNERQVTKRCAAAIRTLMRPAALAQPVEQAAAPELTDAEHFIQEAIDRAPEPLRRLGEYLSRVLNEDEWKTAERLLLGAALPPQPAAQPAMPDCVLVPKRLIEWAQQNIDCVEDELERHAVSKELDKYLLVQPAHKDAEDAIAAIIKQVCGEYRIGQGYDYEDVFNIVEAAIQAQDRDAQRYRWLRDENTQSLVFVYPSDKDEMSGKELDAAIDAAIQGMDKRAEPKEPTT